MFHVRIFPDDDGHPGGWGTILVGALRFGGTPTLAKSTATIADNREFSSYFILDITIAFGKIWVDDHLLRLFRTGTVHQG